MKKKIFLMNMNNLQIIINKIILTKTKIKRLKIFLYKMRVRDLACLNKQALSISPQIIIIIQDF